MEMVEAGYVAPGVVFVDGTHIKANANLKKTVKEEVPIEAKRYAKELMDEVNAELGFVDTLITHPYSTVISKDLPFHLHAFARLFAKSPWIPWVNALKLKNCRQFHRLAMTVFFRRFVHDDAFCNKEED